MPTVTDICNQALNAAGARADITDIDEGSTESKACNRHFVPVRDQILRAANWGFARKTATAELMKSAPGTPENPTGATAVWDSANPPPGWLYEYAYPADCLRIRYITPQSLPYSALPSVPMPQFNFGAFGYVAVPPVRFESALDTIEGVQTRVFLTDARQALVVYTVRVTNPNTWDQSFQQAMVDALGASISFTLSGDKDLAKLLFQKANATITEARVADGNEGLTVIDQVPDWIAARDGYVARPLPYYGPYGPLFGV